MLLLTELKPCIDDDDDDDGDDDDDDDIKELNYYSLKLKKKWHCDLTSTFHVSL